MSAETRGEVCSGSVVKHEGEPGLGYAVLCFNLAPILG